MLRGYFTNKGWDREDLISEVIVIPVEVGDTGQIELIAKIFAYTDTLWWYGRFSVEAKVACANKNCAEGDDVAFFSHLAATTRINPRSLSSAYKILFVADT